MNTEAKSAVFARAFNFLGLGALVASELFLRAFAGAGAFEVLPAWFARGESRWMVSCIWAAAGFGFALMAAGTARAVYALATGMAENIVYLGGLLSKGFYVVRAAGARSTPMFVPHIAATDREANSGFHAVYQRMVLLRDGEGNLSPANTLGAGRIAFSAFWQVLLLGIAASCLLVVATGFRARFARGFDLPAAWDALGVQQPQLIGMLAAVVAMYAAVIAFAAWRMRHVDRRRVPVWPLPDAVTRKHATLSGTVLDGENHTGAESERHYRRYTFRFEDTGFAQTMFVSWSARRIFDADRANAIGGHRKQLRREQTYNERLFAYLDAAQQSGQPVQCRVAKYDLTLVPLLPDADAPEDDDAEAET